MYQSIWMIFEAAEPPRFRAVTAPLYLFAFILTPYAQPSLDADAGGRTIDDGIPTLSRILTRFLGEGQRAVYKYIIIQMGYPPV